MLVMDQKFSIVLVIKEITHQNGVEHNNLDRFMQVGMVTYEKFMDRRGLHEFIIVAPGSDIKNIQTRLTAAYGDWPWRFVNEDAIVLRSLPNGWAKQQTAKFAVAALIKTPHYLIIDDDTYLTKSFGRENLFHDGKLILNKCAIDFIMFFYWSARVLKSDFDKVQYAPYHMAITPQIFITDRVRELVGWLESAYGARMQWQQYLADNKFTEYTMYWQFLMTLGNGMSLCQELYACEETAPAMYGYATTGPEHNLKLQVKRSFNDNDKHYFSFVQTSLPFSNKEVAAEVRKYL